MSNLLMTIGAFLKQKFAYIETAVEGAFTMILSEIPGDEVAALHTAMTAASDALHAGKSAEEAFTAGLHALVAAEKAEPSKLARELLQAFVTATAAPPVAA